MACLDQKQDVQGSAAIHMMTASFENSTVVPSPRVFTYNVGPLQEKASQGYRAFVLPGTKRSGPHPSGAADYDRLSSRETSPLLRLNPQGREPAQVLERLETCDRCRLSEVAFWVRPLADVAWVVEEVPRSCAGRVAHAQPKSRV